MAKTFYVSDQEMRNSIYGESMDGICLSCGARQGGVEPDATGYTCEACEEPLVWGIEQAFLEGRVLLGTPEGAV